MSWPVLADLAMAILPLAKGNELNYAHTYCSLFQNLRYSERMVVVDTLTTSGAVFKVRQNTGGYLSYKSILIKVIFFIYLVQL